MIIKKRLHLIWKTYFWFAQSSCSMNSRGSNFLGLKMNGRKNRNANLPKKLHDLNLSCFIRLSVLLGLCGYTLFIVYRGPFSMLLRNTTVIRENEITIEDEGMYIFLGQLLQSIKKYLIHISTCINHTAVNIFVLHGA